MVAAAPTAPIQQAGNRMVSDQDRAIIYRELADLMDEVPPHIPLTEWVREKADELDDPQAEWERSLNLDADLPDNPLRLEDALLDLRHALAEERYNEPEKMLLYAQQAAAHIVAWRKTQPSGKQTPPKEPPPHYGSEMSDRSLLRDAVLFLLQADAAPNAAPNLRKAEGLLFMLWERHR